MQHSVLHQISATRFNPVTSLAAANSTTELHNLSSGTSVAAFHCIILTLAWNIVFVTSSYLITWSIAMAENNDVFQMLVVENKLDASNYPFWVYMMGMYWLWKAFGTPPNIIKTGDIGGVEDDNLQLPGFAEVPIAYIHSRFVRMAEMQKNIHC